MKQELFAEFNLQATGPVPGDVPKEGRLGKPLGAGEGTVTGAIEGVVRWNLFEDQRGDFCGANHDGVIETGDGARIEFSTLGFYKQQQEPNGHLWTLAAGLILRTEDEKYRWLTDRPALLEGEVDLKTYKLRAEAYFPEEKTA